jgi:DNA-directed RNA polymerase specialized sigma24 family protein
MKESGTRYADIDWERIRKVLIVRAVQLRMIAEPVVDAMEPYELPDQVMSEFYGHPNRLGWDPKKGPLESFLLAVLHRLWIDHCRRETKIARSSDDGDTLSEPAAEPQKQPEGLENKELLGKLRQLVPNDPQLLEVIDAVELLDGEYEQPKKELAELIGTSVEDVENRKKRLRRALSGDRL